MQRVEACFGLESRAPVDDLEVESVDPAALYQLSDQALHDSPSFLDRTLVEGEDQCQCIGSAEDVEGGRVQDHRLR
ncbi:MAG: hypothetical protein ACI8PZ_002414 [Myxococcota bacterium]|jgi:hypothetical protein